MTRPTPIVDYYGTEISVEVCGHSVGYMVDVDRVTVHPDPATQGGTLTTFDSLTAEQARDLASRLVAAAEDIEAHS